MDKKQLLYIVSNYEGVCDGCFTKFHFDLVVITGPYKLFDDPKYADLNFIILGTLERAEDFPFGQMAFCPNCLRSFLFTRFTDSQMKSMGIII